MLPEPATLIPSAMTMAASLGYGFVSAVVPVVNAELYIVAAASVVPRAQQPVMVTIFTLGTMAGKMALYLLAARLVSSRSAKARAQVEQWVDRLRPSFSQQLLVMTSGHDDDATRIFFFP